MTKLGALVIDLEGKKLSAEDQELLSHPLIGGVILFARNYESREQLQDLCRAIRESSPHPLLMMVDQEGGRVQRFIKDFTQLPAMATFGETYNNDPKQACASAFECGYLMASEVCAVGIDLSLAPVLDLQKNFSKAIGNRAFHPDPHAVIDLASAFIAGMKKAGMAATGKHFPGHGSVHMDSHVATPRDERTLSELMQSDLLPFIELIKQKLPAVMTAHIVFPAIDQTQVSFSHYWLKNILRDQLGFTGVIFSDDLSMQGANISANYTDRVRAAKEAGCDFLLLCNQRAGVKQVLKDLSHEPYWVEEEKWHVLQKEIINGRAYGFK